MGILFAAIALFSWGLGDFLIQKSARKFGDWVALFYVTAAAAIALFPFVLSDLLLVVRIDPVQLGLLFLASGIFLFAAIYDFKALRIGKLAVVEPIYALEVPLTAFLATVIIDERLTGIQTLLIVLVMAGIFLVSVRSFGALKRIHLERGVRLALIATIAMGCVNFFFGVGARETSPLLINWFTSAFIAIVAGVYLLVRKQTRVVLSDVQNFAPLIIAMCFFDNLAWIAYAYSTTFIPIAIAIGFSESYIVFAAMLGFVFNKERLKAHQVAGFFITVISAITLAFLTGG